MENRVQAGSFPENAYTESIKQKAQSRGLG